MCLDVDCADTQEKFERKAVLETLNTHKSTIKKIFAAACKWDMNNFDMSKFMIFLQCCKLGDLVRQTRFLLFSSRMKTSVTTIQQVFYICIGLICLDDIKRNKPKVAGKPAKTTNPGAEFDKVFSAWLTSKMLYAACTYICNPFGNLLPGVFSDRLRLIAQGTGGRWRTRCKYTGNPLHDLISRDASERLLVVTGRTSARPRQSQCPPHGRRRKTPR